ncbi:MAG: nicotinate-nucleotide--dimethylbenzimidazole phosphoribosyltransferase [Candidatus Omnitrophica bacterium]|nr:nicotinate-nucleotide--dimethylbenzimidazole phosphoribosyltransferase [Candidatus Omnitrophota bacterium]
MIEKTIGRIRAIDEKIMAQAQERLDNLTKPRGSLGRLEEFAKKVAGITRNLKPSFGRKVIFTMAGDHGVACEGVSLFPQEVTCQMVANFISGGAGINVLARHVGAEVIVVDMGIAKQLTAHSSKLIGFKDKKINYGTKNMAKGPAMTRKEAIRSIEAGIEVFEEEFNKQAIDIVGTGDMGIANTTASSAIATVITGRPCQELTGLGTGLNDDQLKLKVKIIEQALKLNKPDPEDPIDILSKVGGYEIGGICGIILAAASKSIPVAMDGFISSAGALIACKLAPKAKDYIFAAHMSREKGHKAVLEHMGLKPILDLEMRLGEGTGAAVAIGVIEAGVKIYNEMATFKEAKVSTQKKQ